MLLGLFLASFLLLCDNSHAFGQAKEKGIIVLCSPHDTATTVKLALCARKVRNIISDDFMALSSNQVVSRFSRKVAASS